MPMRLLYVAATSDIITGYTFDASVEYLKKDDLNAQFFESVWASFEMAWWIVHIPLLGPLMNSIPASIMGFMMPGLDSLRQMQRVSPLISAIKSCSLTRSAMASSD